jgi:Uma2 family endonuclease
LGVPQNSPICNFDDYLVFERAEEVRREYCDGQIYAMAGESLEHSTISANLIGILHGQLKGKPCRALSPNMKVLSGELLPGQTSGLFSYPDVTVE